MQLDVRRISSAGAAELYLAAALDPAAEPSHEAARAFAAIEAEALRCQGRICRTRVFVPDGCLAAYRRAMEVSRPRLTMEVGRPRLAMEVGHPRPSLDVPCSWLRSGPTMPGVVQAHVIAGPADWRPLTNETGGPAGWTWTRGRLQWAVAGGLCVPRGADNGPKRAASDAFVAAERLLGQAGMGLCDVARTWFFLDDILGWYDDFNAARTRLFKDRGLLAGGPRAANSKVPASTGIGVTPLPTNGSMQAPRLALEVFAVRGADECIVRRPAAGRQRSAYEYGSAFARAAAALTPAGRTVFVSGTAAIDAAGRTCCPGDPAGQIRMTLDNVLAVLAGERCSPDSAVQAIAYCKTPAVAAEFNERFRRERPWPWAVVVADVCRDDLLFEAEVTACAAAE